MPGGRRRHFSHRSQHTHGSSISSTPGSSPGAGAGAGAAGSGASPACVVGGGGGSGPRRRHGLWGSPRRGGDRGAGPRFLPPDGTMRPRNPGITRVGAPPRPRRPRPGPKGAGAASKRDGRAAACPGTHRSPRGRARALHVDVAFLLEGDLGRRGPPRRHRRFPRAPVPRGAPPRDSSLAAPCPARRPALAATSDRPRRAHVVRATGAGAPVPGPLQTAPAGVGDPAAALPPTGAPPPRAPARPRPPARGLTARPPAPPARPPAPRSRTCSSSGSGAAAWGP